MKIHEYNEMMAYLTRPSYVSGGRVGFDKGSKPKYSFSYDSVPGAEYIFSRRSLTSGKMSSFTVEINYYPLKKDFKPVKYSKSFGVATHGGVAKALEAAKAHVPEAKKIISQWETARAAGE